MVMSEKEVRFTVKMQKDPISEVCSGIEVHNGHGNKNKRIISVTEIKTL